ncbi:MAG: MBOAT family protein [Saprospiraceae bacterium]|nr:MBOAT family protein [Saprospiraceae bacterium]
MLFSSLIFLYSFLPLLLLALLLLPKSWHNGILLLASLVFYAWGGVSYTVILLLSILLNYGIGRWIAARPAAGAKSVLILGLVLNLGLLVFFKYALFLLTQINIGLERLGEEALELPKIVLPLGISFFTFQGISYLVDVYRGTTEVQKNIGRLGLYIALFPQLIAGPIVRYQDLAGQLGARSVGWVNSSLGLERFVIGLAKKVLLANNFALVADAIFSAQPASLSWPLAWLGVMVYALQIYFDFSGYSDMAIGLGRMFGFVIPENFNFPYIARSVREFWRRWHISLSQWFRDYVYISLGGNRGSSRQTYRNLVLVFLLTGFWHGASWTFVCWGAFHGLFMLAERGRFGQLLVKSPKPLQHLYLLLVIGLSWVIFRAETLAYAAGYYLRLLGVGESSDFQLDISSYLDWEFRIVLALGLLFSIPFARFRLQTGVNELVGRLNMGQIGRAFLFLLLFLVCTMELANDSYNPFIYFRF